MGILEKKHDSRQTLILTPFALKAHRFNRTRIDAISVRFFTHRSLLVLLSRIILLHSLCFISIRPSSLGGFCKVVICVSFHVHLSASEFWRGRCLYLFAPNLYLRILPLGNIRFQEIKNMTSQKIIYGTYIRTLNEK
jgi:hypothetical protein